MPAPDWEDLSEFLENEEFASAVMVTAPSGAVLRFNAIFDNPYMNIELGEYEFDTATPRLTCREADVATVERGDIATVDGREYDILTGPQSDGTGMAMLMLDTRP